MRNVDHSHDRQQAYVARGSTIAVTPYKQSARRKKCRNDFIVFCQTYLPHRFPLPDSKDQIECKEKIQHATLKGGMFAQSAPRGDGKTSRVIAGVIWATLYGHKRFVVAIGATAKHGQALVDEIIREIADNEHIRKDWPEISRFVRLAYEKPPRARYLAYRIGTKTELARVECKGGTLVFPTVPACKDAQPLGGIIIRGAGIGAAIKGLRHTAPDGSTLRPDLALLDDIQTSESAMSVSQTDKILAIVRGDIKRLGAPDRELSAVICCTVACKGDAADQLLDNVSNPQWRGVRKKMVYCFPKHKDLWVTYTNIRKEGLLDGDGGKAANEYYKEHRQDMDDGAVVGWEHRFRKDIGEISAIQCAYNILCDDGEDAFQSECQNEPVEKKFSVITLTPDVVMSRLNGLESGTTNQLTKYVSGFIDINRRGLAYTIVAWQPNLTGNVLAYGWHPSNESPIWSEKNPKGETEEQAIYRNLVELSELLMQPIFKRDGVSLTIDRILIDTGYKEQPVFQFLQFAHAVKHWTCFGASRGRSCKFFKFPTDKERFEYAHFEMRDKCGVQLVHDADYHRMKVQEAFALQTGAPCSLSLAGDKPTAHREFAKHICSEQLRQFIVSQVPNKSGVYEWTRVPASLNEWLDCLVGCRVGAVLWLARTMQVVTPPVTTNARTPDPIYDRPPGQDNGWGIQLT